MIDHLLNIVYTALSEYWVRKLIDIIKSRNVLAILNSYVTDAGNQNRVFIFSKWCQRYTLYMRAYLSFLSKILSFESH